MALLIDGYNLLYATDLFGSGSAAGTLEGSRQALLGFLAAVLSDSERRRTTIVFDASQAPPGLPATTSHAAITVHFARDYPDADAMLEALIEAAPRGKGLTVISSDHRVQRAARGHGARWQDAESWYREMRSRPQPEASDRGKSTDPSVGDADYWAEEFSDQATLNALEEDRKRSVMRPPPTSMPTPEEQTPKPRRTKPKQPFGEGIFEGFPPGYGDDLAAGFDEPPNDDSPEP